MAYVAAPHSPLDWIYHCTPIVNPEVSRCTTPPLVAAKQSYFCCALCPLPTV